MKKLFAIVLILALALCGCAEKPDISSSSVILNEETPDILNSSNDLSVESDVSTSSFSQPTKEYSKWNTVNFSSNVWGGTFCYDKQNDTYYYQRTEFKNEKYNYAIIAEKDGEKHIISEEAAWYMYFFEGKIYYTNGEEIVSINADGSERKVLAKTDSAKLIYPYKEYVYYCSSYDWKLHKISPDGTDRIVETRDMKVHYYMIYEDKIYYAGYPEISISTNLYSLDIETGEQKLLFDELFYGVEIANDKVYFVSENDEIICCNLDGSNREKLISEGTSTAFVYSDKIIYFPINSIDVKKFDLKTEESRTIALIDDNVAWYQCNDKFIVSVTDDGKITKVDI